MVEINHFVVSYPCHPREGVVEVALHDRRIHATLARQEFDRTRCWSLLAGGHGKSGVDNRCKLYRLVLAAKLTESRAVFTVDGVPGSVQAKISSSPNRAMRG